MYCGIAARQPDLPATIGLGRGGGRLCPGGGARAGVGPAWRFRWGVDLAKSGLSAGEKQLVTLVRAHLAATPIIVLDEATCHLDPAAEEKAERAFMATGSTLIVVAHRMSATLRAKRVMVMDGDGIDVGDHRQLMQRHALYADFHGMWSVPTTGQLG